MFFSLDGRDSIEILSEEEGDGRPRPPLREWRIKKEMVEMVDTGEAEESCSPPSPHMDQSLSKLTETDPKPSFATNVFEELRKLDSKENEQRQTNDEEEIISLSSDEDEAPDYEQLPIVQLQQVPSDPPEAASAAPVTSASTPVRISQVGLEAPTQMSPPFSPCGYGSTLLGQNRRAVDDTYDSIDYAPPTSRKSQSQDISDRDAAFEEEELPIIHLQQVPSDPPEEASPDLSEIAVSTPARLVAPTQTSSIRSRRVILEQRGTNDSIDNRPRSRGSQPQEIVLSDSDGSVTETLETCPNRTVMISEDEDNDRAENSCAEDKDKSDSENSYVALVRDEREDFKKEDDDIEELLRNSPTDVVTLSDSEQIVTAAPPPPPSDLDMRAALFGERRRSQSRGQERRSRSRSGEAPLFVIGAPRTVREESESDEDVRIVPGRSERTDENCIQID